MRLFSKFTRFDAIGLGIGFLVSLCLFGPSIFEPTDKPRFEDVTIVSYRMGFKGSQTFTVISVKTGKSWQVGAARGPYSSDYRGAAILSLSRRRWTGKDHLLLLPSEPSTNRPKSLQRGTALSVHREVAGCIGVAACARLIWKLNDSNIQIRAVRCLLIDMKHIAALFGLCLFASGCAQSQLQIHDLQGTCGANYEHTFHQPLLLDAKTGRSWVLRWDEQKFYWQPVSITNAPSLPR
jgi:hypothetical protein